MQPVFSQVFLRAQPELGPFSFQAVLQESGDIVFLYQSIPSSVIRMKAKIGLAIGNDETFKNLLVDEDYLKRDPKIESNTSVYWHALPDCPRNGGSCAFCVDIDGCQWCDNPGYGIKYLSGNITLTKYS